MVTMGRVIKDQHLTVYLKLHSGLDPFVWGGRCMRLEETTESLGDITVTTRQNPRGGLERDGVTAGAPGLASGTLAMKRIAADTVKTELKTCFWDVDKRYHCDGIDLDAWNKWDEISRLCMTKMGDRALGGGSFGPEDAEESMVTFAANALYEEDIYRVAAENMKCFTPA